MPMKAYQATAKEAGYEGPISSHLDGIVEDVGLGRKNGFSLSFPQGKFESFKIEYSEYPFIYVKHHVLKAYVTVEPTQEQLQGLYKQITDAIFDSFRMQTRTISLELDRSLGDLHYKLVPEEGEYRYYLPMGVELPQDLFRGEMRWQNEGEFAYSVHRGLDKEKHERAKRIARALEMEGHKVEIVESPHTMSVQIYSKDYHPEELVQAMTVSDGVTLYLTPRKGSRTETDRLVINARPERVSMRLRKEVKRDITKHGVWFGPYFLHELSEFADAMDLSADAESPVKYRMQVPHSDLVTTIITPFRAVGNIVSEYTRRDAERRAAQEIFDEETSLIPSPINIGVGERNSRIRDSIAQVDDKYLAQRTKELLEQGNEDAKH